MIAVVNLARLIIIIVCALTLCGFGGCVSKITHTDRKRGAPGDEFTIYGTALKDNESLPPVPPVLRRCSELSLIVLDLQEDHIRVRIPPVVPAGMYEVQAFGIPTGAYKRGRTNSLPFWVTAGHVPDNVADRYEVQVKSFRSRYGKNAQWESWMLANRARYENVVNASLALSCPITIAVSYATPLQYNPPWINETEHMLALKRLAELHFPGYQFDFRFGLERSAAYAQCILGQPGDSSGDPATRTLRLHYETIFGHEFGHIVNVLHHYEGDSLGNSGFHFPPGESLCIMDRNDNQYCSACRTALNVALDVDNYQAIDDAMEVIYDRYPPGW
jgi:hypothetical protein